jgi:hypothetical protein
VKEFTIKVSEATERNCKVIASRKGLTFNECLAEMLERGADDYIYRMNRNKKQAAISKAEKAQFKAMVEKLKELGIGADEL